MRVVTIVFVTALVAGATAVADTPPGANFSIWMENAGHVWVSPAGTGPALSEAFGPDGGTVDATIHVELLNDIGDPIVGYPAEDMYLDTWTLPDLSSCSSLNIADGPTDADGRTTFSQPLLAGGQCLAPDQIVVAIAGSPYPADLPLTITSPDLDGDLMVNLTDVSMMVQALGDDDAPADFDQDGAVDLTDIAIFVSVIAEHCP
jgi:hypothetical protein